MRRSKKNSSVPALIAAIIILLGIAGYLAFDRSQLAQSNSAYRDQIKQAEIAQEDLQVSYDDINNQLDAMKSDNSELNALIEKQKTQLSQQRSKINKLIWSDKKWKEAKEQLEVMEQMGRDYMAQIKDLKEKNTVLSNENVQLKREKTELSEVIEVTKSEKQDLEKRKNQLEIQTKNLAKERDLLNEKVDLASVVKVKNIQTNGYKIRRNGKLAKRNNAKYVDQITTCFNTEKNLITDKNQEEFYLRVITPLGQTMAIEDLGSGVFIGASDGQSIRYTKSKVINYSIKEQTVCIVWQPNTKFMSGIYEIKLYNKGHECGSSKFRLK